MKPRKLITPTDLYAKAEADLKKADQALDFLMQRLRDGKTAGLNKYQLIALAVRPYARPKDSLNLAILIALAVAALRLIDAQDSQQITTAQ